MGQPHVVDKERGATNYAECWNKRSGQGVRAFRSEDLVFFQERFLARIGAAVVCHPVHYSKFQFDLRHRHSRLLSAGIQRADRTGCPTEAFEHDCATRYRRSTWKPRYVVMFVVGVFVTSDDRRHFVQTSLAAALWLVCAVLFALWPADPVLTVISQLAIIPCQFLLARALLRYIFRARVVDFNMIDPDHGA